MMRINKYHAMGLVVYAENFRGIKSKEETI